MAYLYKSNYIPSVLIHITSDKPYYIGTIHFDIHKGFLSIYIVKYKSLTKLTDRFFRLKLDIHKLIARKHRLQVEPKKLTVFRLCVLIILALFGLLATLLSIIWKTAHFE